MKMSKKFIAFSMLLCLLPVVIGVFFLPQLPEQIAIHWGADGSPNGWAGKNWAVFGLPIFMALVQFGVCLPIFLQMKGEALPKIGQITKWLIPVLNPVIYFSTIYIAIGNKLDMRLISCIIVSSIFIVLGNYLTKIPQGQMKKWPYNRVMDEKEYRKSVHRTAIIMISLGLTLILSLLFSALISVIVLVTGIILILIISLSSFFVKK